jgi:hypothetical protein
MLSIYVLDSCIRMQGVLAAQACLLWRRVLSPSQVRLRGDQGVNLGSFDVRALGRIMKEFDASRARRTCAGLRRSGGLRTGEMKRGTRRVVCDRERIKLYLAAAPFRAFVRRDLYRKPRDVLSALRRCGRARGRTYSHDKARLRPAGPAARAR